MPDKPSENITESQPVTTKTVVLSEALDLTESSVDTDNRVIKNVVLIRAGMSMNRRYYGEKALQEAVDVFQNSKAYADHPSKDEQRNRPERSIRDLSGWYANVHYSEGKLIADRYFTRTVAGNDAWAIAEDIASKRAPSSLAGLSINAVGKGAMRKFDDGEALEVTSITGANSVDDVSTPSAKGSYLLTASTGGDEITKGVLEALDYEEWLLARPEFVDKLKREWKQVRLEEATKAAIAESDVKLKAAVTDTETANEALQEAQTENGTLRTANEKLMTEITLLRLDKAVYEALDGVQLPAVYIKDLRASLPKLPTAEWVGKIETEKSKVKSAGVRPKVTVTHANVSINEAVDFTQDKQVTSPLPQGDESVTEWIARTKRSSKR